ncbi:MAG: alpha/beta hydrolase [Caulobacterales bacterium 32-69-10]|nr:MAG: alpha/beta hydrolase [Caulobacterales bacterium 32-69-10]
MRRTGRFLVAASVAVTATAGVVSWLFQNELGRMRVAARMGSLIASPQAGAIEYADRGVGVPLLSIHGSGGGFDQGLANAADLAGEGFRVIAPSRFGYLRTPVPEDVSPAAQADAHAKLLSELKIPRAVVVGVSAGARSAVELALRRPDMVSALILVVPGLYAPDSPVSIGPSWGSRFAFRVVNVGGDFAWWLAETAAPSMLIRFLGVPPDLVAAAPQAERDRVMGIVRSVEPLSWRFAGINIDSTPDLHEAPLGRIDAPTLIVSARDDLFNTLPAAQFSASKIVGAELVVYDTGGHLLVGRGEDVRAAVRAFLARAGVTPSPEAGP